MIAVVMCLCATSDLLIQVENHHETANPLFAKLREPGVAVTPERRLPLPPPTMPDGLDAPRQREIIEQLVKQDHAPEEFLRRSLVAPYLLKIRELERIEPLGRIQAVDLWCIAYGSLDQFRRSKHPNLFFKSRSDAKVHELTSEELAARSLESVTRDDFEELFSFATFDIFDKVQLSQTNHTMLSRLADSIVVATEIDGRFQQDQMFPNQWRPLLRAGAGELTLGEPQPYQGLGLYSKVTRLHEPAGALFCEHHLIFLEPQGWFNGANLLRSKLPIAMQTEVRSFRRELSKTAPSP